MPKGMMCQPRQGVQAAAEERDVNRRFQGNIERNPWSPPSPPVRARQVNSRSQTSPLTQDSNFSSVLTMSGEDQASESLTGMRIPIHRCPVAVPLKWRLDLRSAV